MNITSTHGIDARPPLTPRVLAAVVLAVMSAGFAVSIGSGAWAAEAAPFPFVWRDVAIVHIACAIPLAWLLRQWICWGGTSTPAVLLSALLLGLSFAPSHDAVRVALLGALPMHPIAGITLREGTAFAFALSAVIVGSALLGRRDSALTPRRFFAFALLGLVALLAAPMLYVHARGRHDRSRLADFLAQGRVGEARMLAHSLLALDAQADWQGQPLTKVATILDQQTHALDALVAVPLPGAAPDNIRLRRAQYLAMLGQTEAALEVLHPVADCTIVADADNLRGTIHEARGEWPLALAAYQMAKDACLARPPTPERTSQVLRATTGIAYAQRKAGDYVGAEATYQELLTLAPNSETHYLLAQFYEDAQNARKASYHARRAILLNPERYRKDGELLLRKLAVFQFGCLRALGSDRGR